MGSAGSVGGRGVDSRQQAVGESSQAGDSRQQAVGESSQAGESSHGRKRTRDDSTVATPSWNGWDLSEPAERWCTSEPAEFHIQVFSNEHRPYGHVHNSDEGRPAVIMWIHGGMSVSVVGSWDNWKTVIPLERSENDFSVVKALLPGFYQYGFIVDGLWRRDPDLPWMCDETGNAFNVLDLKDNTTDKLDMLEEDLEIPESPDSSYTDDSDFLENYSKPPPPVPPQLNIRPYVERDMSTFPKPPHTMLNHLHIRKPEMDVIAVGETCRFRSKFVTTVLYKPHEDI